MDGYWSEDYSDDAGDQEFFLYADICGPGDRLTVTTADETKTYVAETYIHRWGYEAIRFVNEADGSDFALSVEKHWKDPYGGDRPKTVEVIAEQDVDNQWRVGPHEATVLYMGCECKASIAVVPNPIDSISFNPAKPYKLVKEVDGEWVDDEYVYEIEEGTEVSESVRYFVYDLPDWQDGDTLTIRYADQSIGDVSYVYNSEKVQFINSNVSNDTISLDRIERWATDYQWYEYRWDVGVHELNIRYMGRVCTVPVEVVESADDQGDDNGDDPSGDDPSGSGDDNPSGDVPSGGNNDGNGEGSSSGNGGSADGRDHPVNQGGQTASEQQSQQAASAAAGIQIGQSVAAGTAAEAGTYIATGNSTVTYQKPAKGKKAVSIPQTLVINGKTYTVTGIARGAFKNTKTKTVTIKSTKLSKKSVKNCFKGSKVKTVKVKVGNKKLNKKYVKKYKKFFTKKNCGKKVTVK